MAIGDAFSAAEISPYEWANFATECKLSLRLVSQELEKMAGLVLKVIEDVKQKALHDGAEPHHLSLVADTIKTECQRQLAIAPQVRGVSSALF